MLCYSDNGAGLRDRIAVITQLLRWVWVLDIRLRLPPPCELLTPRHNQHIPLQCNITWDRYIDIHPKHLLTTNSCSLHLTQFYSVKNSVVLQYTQTIPVHVTWSSIVHREMSQIAEEMHLPDRYDMVQIRRSDAITECNTNILRMQGVLRTRAFATTNILYATDEKDRKYNAQIVRTLTNRNLTVYVVEPWLQRRHPRDNYMAFAVGQLLLHRAVAKHEWRRRLSCP